MLAGMTTISGFDGKHYKQLRWAMANDNREGLWCFG